MIRSGGGGFCATSFRTACRAADLRRREPDTGFFGTYHEMTNTLCKSRRPWGRRAAAYCVAAFTFAAALPALGQTRDYALPGGQDYYSPRVTQDEIRTLANVELYHLGPGQEKMAKGRYLQALQDFEFILG